MADHELENTTQENTHTLITGDAAWTDSSSMNN